MESKRGSRDWSFGTGTTSRRRETAFLEEISVGACLEERLKSLWSARPALRSRDSALVQVSVGSEGFEAFFWGLDLDLGLERVAEALARAPKEMEAASRGSGSDDASDCLFVRYYSSLKVRICSLRGLHFLLHCYLLNSPPHRILGLKLLSWRVYPQYPRILLSWL
jgi:hypothetical protein